MISHEVIHKYIADTGYRSIAEIKAQFSSCDDEILGMTLTYLLEKRLVRKVKVKTPDRVIDLYFIAE